MEKKNPPGWFVYPENSSDGFTNAFIAAVEEATNRGEKVIIEMENHSWHGDEAMRMMGIHKGGLNEWLVDVLKTDPLDAK